MTETLKKRCELFIENYNTIRSGFVWENSYLYPICANVFTEKNKRVDAAWLKECVSVLKQKTGLFSNFRGISRLVIASFLAVSEQPERKMEQTLQVYQLLKEHFWASDYLPVAALIVENLAQPAEYKHVAMRTREIYNQMKNEHPFLTSSEDSTLAAVLALSEKSNEQLIHDMEQCYQLLKPNFFTGNSVQSLSHVLALGEGLPDAKCRKLMELFELFKREGCKYGTSYELPTLGVLALLEVDAKTLVSEITEVDAYLKTQKGFGMFGIGAKQRLMYAGMLVADNYINAEQSTLTTAAINSVVAIVIAQQVAICAAIAASSAAAASASS